MDSTAMACENNGCGTVLNICCNPRPFKSNNVILKSKHFYYYIFFIFKMNTLKTVIIFLCLNLLSYKPIYTYYT